MGNRVSRARRSWLPISTQEVVAHGPQSGDPRSSGSSSSRSNSSNANRDKDKIPAGKKHWANIKRSIAFIWPWGKPALQLRIGICLVILVAVRAIKLMTPVLYKHSIDALGQDPRVYPVGMILAYGFMRSSTSVLKDLRGYLWLAVGNHTYEKVSTDTFEHLHNLSLAFHLQRKTGAVLRVMNRGRGSITTMLQFFLFNLGPLLLDLMLVVGYFLIYLSWEFGMTIFICLVSYIGFTIVVTEWRNKFRRAVNDRNNATNERCVDSLLNFETVKYFGAESHEVDHYRRTILDYVQSTVKSQTSLAFLNGGQNLIVTLGLLVGMLLAGKRVADGEMSTGDFVLINTYILQVYEPLSWLGTSYSMVNQALIDMEQMWDLFDVQPDIVDVPNAPPLRVSKGEVQFRDVTFAYKSQDRNALTNLSFTIKPGTTTAIIGKSGAGKSTITRLLYRFYNLEHGDVLIDGQSVSQVQQQSLRHHIGVVPQDTVLFNDTILYNIRYGKPGATYEEVLEAAKAAQIHDKIMTFPDNYDTVVGERGLRLSGGEKQRVAIARTLLKNPPIVILDEATSALDTHTEKAIQQSLATVTQGRTTLIIAHRLSTIVHADEIIVLDSGVTVERGTHNELMARSEGIYARMWEEQQHQGSGSGSGGCDGDDGDDGDDGII